MALTLTLQQELQKIIRGVLKFNETMRDHTTIKIGGPADAWIEPLDIDDLINIIRFADEKGINRMVFGNGSNALVRDKGIRGIVISLANFDYIQSSVVSRQSSVVSNTDDQQTTDDRRPTTIMVGAGVHLQKLIGWSCEQSLSGFECLAGIPGTVGGAIVMNAGIKEGTIGDVVKNVKYVSREKVTTAKREDLEFSYRRLKLPKNAVVFEAEFVLKPGNKQEIEAQINKRRKQRGEIQPILWPSMGSVFKNPNNAPKTWQLINDAGLRGVRVGEARVSNEHANWIVNEGKATAKDVEVLIKMIKDRVKEKSDISLETEIVIVGE